MRLGDGKTLTTCPCRDRCIATVTLCAVDAARSHRGVLAHLCTAHEDEYEERLKSLQCRTPGCQMLVTTATIPDESRSGSARLRSAGDVALGKLCCVCTIVGVDETSRPATLDRFGVFIDWSDVCYEGDPNSPARPLSPD